MYCLLFRLIVYQFHNRLQPVIYLNPNTRVFALALIYSILLYLYQCDLSCWIPVVWLHLTFSLYKVLQCSVSERFSLVWLVYLDILLLYSPAPLWTFWQTVSHEETCPVSHGDFLYYHHIYSADAWPTSHMPWKLSLLGSNQDIPMTRSREVPPHWSWGSLEIENVSSVGVNEINALVHKFPFVEHDTVANKSANVSHRHAGLKKLSASLHQTINQVLLRCIQHRQDVISSQVSTIIVNVSVNSMILL